MSANLSCQIQPTIDSVIANRVPRTKPNLNIKPLCSTTNNPQIIIQKRAPIRIIVAIYCVNKSLKVLMGQLHRSA